MVVVISLTLVLDQDFAPAPDQRRIITKQVAYKTDSVQSALGNALVEVVRDHPRYHVHGSPKWLVPEELVFNEPAAKPAPAAPEASPAPAALPTPEGLGTPAPGGPAQ